MNLKYLAQSINVGGQNIQGPLDVGQGTGNNVTLAAIVNRVVQFLIPVAGIILLLVLIWGGYDYMMSGGTPDKIKSAQAKLTTAIIGFILLITSYILVKVITMIFGITGGFF